MLDKVLLCVLFIIVTLRLGLNKDMANILTYLTVFAVMIILVYVVMSNFVGLILTSPAATP